jgi:Vitamin K-dependent gamma-carboxylase
MSLKALLKIWNDFFFKPVSPLPVALFRIAYGTLVLIMLITESMPDWDFWYGPNSPVQVDVLRDFFFRCPVFDLFDIIPVWANHSFMWLVFAATICVTIGLFTRLSTVFLWVALVSIDHHNPWNLSGSDDMMRFLAFGLMFTRCGEMLSVDSWWKRKRHPELIRTEFAPWGQRMIQLQLAIAYWGASVAKLGGNQWVDGTAIYYSSHLQDFFRLPVGQLFDSLAVCQFLSWSTLVIETSLWSLIWFKELRYWVLLAGVCLHIGIDYTMSLPVFEMEFVAAYLVFIEPSDLKNLGRWIQSMFDQASAKVLKTHQRIAVPAVQATSELQVSASDVRGATNEH